jgi:hypothetical protein
VEADAVLGGDPALFDAGRRIGNVVIGKEDEIIERHESAARGEHQDAPERPGDTHYEIVAQA